MREYQQNRHRADGSTWIARFSTVFSTVVENWLEHLSLAMAFM